MTTKLTLIREWEHKEYAPITDEFGQEDGSTSCCFIGTGKVFLKTPTGEEIPSGIFESNGGRFRYFANKNKRIEIFFSTNQVIDR